MHKLTVTTKLIVFLLLSVATMVTYDTRVLVAFLVMSLAIFKVSRVRYRQSETHPLDGLCVPFAE